MRRDHGAAERFHEHVRGEASMAGLMDNVPLNLKDALSEISINENVRSGFESLSCHKFL